MIALQPIILPQLEFHGADNSEKFFRIFADLYRIELFKDGLDLILTKMQEKHLRFEIKPIKGWDTNSGCFLTEPKSFYDKTLGKFVHKKELKIILRQMTHNLLAHEMAHALEYESGLDLGQEFRMAIGLDMKNREPQIITLKAQKNRLMIDALKAYKPEQFLSELFARYFELLSLSRNVQATGDFSTADVMSFFANTTSYLEKIFNPKIRAKIDPRIASITSEIAARIRFEAPQQKFQERVESRQQKTGGQWSKSVKSNAAWQESWKKFQTIEEKK
jgi:hypothetical protein